MAKRKKRFKKEKRAPNFKNDFLKKGFNQKKLFQNVMTKYGLKGYKMGAHLIDDIYADFVFHERKVAIMVDNLSITNREISAVESIGFFLLLVSSDDKEEWLAAISVILGEDLTAIKPKYSWILPGQFENNEAEKVFYRRNGQWIEKKDADQVQQKFVKPLKNSMLLNGKRVASRG